jgi:hypothetical protein
MRFVIERIKSVGLPGLAGFIAVIVALGLIGFVLVARFVNTSPWQCGSCHPQMTELWERSLAHPSAQVTCYECHANHPEMEDSFSSLPAFVRDTLIPEKFVATGVTIEERCISCHEKVATSEKEESRLIRVNHKIHLSSPILQKGLAIELGCMDCHKNIAHDKAQEETNRPRMYTCFVGECHPSEKNQDRCTVCHYQTLLETKEAAK